MLLHLGHVLRVDSLFSCLENFVWCKKCLLAVM